MEELSTWRALQKRPQFCKAKRFVSEGLAQVCIFLKLGSTLSWCNWANPTDPCDFGTSEMPDAAGEQNDTAVTKTASQHRAEA